MRRNILANRSKRRVNDFLMRTHDSYEMHSPIKVGSPMNKTLHSNSSKQEKGKTKTADNLIPLLLYGHLHNRKMVDRFREYNERQDENLRSRITDYSDTLILNTTLSKCLKRSRDSSLESPTSDGHFKPAENF